MILTNIYEFQAMANKYAHIYIYGTGAYGLYLFEKFRELGITIDLRSRKIIPRFWYK